MRYRENPQAEPDLLSVDDFCRAINAGRTAAYELFNSGEVLTVKIGRNRRVPRSEKDRFIASRIEAARRHAGSAP